MDDSSIPKPGQEGLPYRPIFSTSKPTVSGTGFGSLPARRSFMLPPDDGEPVSAGGTPLEELTPRELPEIGEEVGLDEIIARLESSSEDKPDYVMTRLIGEGGQGQVWRAWQTCLGREVAVKQMIAGDTDEFLREAHAAAILEHPNIVPVYDLGRVADQYGERPVLAMKLARGVPWDKMIKADRAATTFALDAFLAKHLPILIDVCNATAFAHSKGIIHRDLKPGQVIVGKYGEAYLMDWGMAVSVDDSPLIEEEDTIMRKGPPEPRLRHTLETATNQCGTPAYMAPEQTWESTAGLSFQTDIYLLGAILWELLTGEPPHAAKDPARSFDMARDNVFESLPPLDAPEGLAAVARKALAASPVERQASVEELRDALADHLTGSGRRDESRAIVAEVAESIPGRDFNTFGHSELIEIKSKLDRALRLWPDNPEALRWSDSADEIHARRAAQSGDLGLAQELALGLSQNNPRREALLESIRSQARQASRHASQRRVTLAACLALLLMMSAGGVWHVFEQKVAEEKLAAERDRADDAYRKTAKAKRAGERLLEFVLTDLANDIRQAGNRELSEKMASKAREFYRRVRTETALDLLSHADAPDEFDADADADTDR